MKSYRRRILRTVLALSCLAFSILTAVLSAAGVYSAVLFAVLSALFSAFGLILGFSVVASMLRLFNLLETLADGAGVVSETSIALAQFVETSDNAEKFNSLEGLNLLLGYINDDIAVLQNSATKFDLFSSDILFSAQNLALQASRQLDTLVLLREQAAGYFEGLSSTNAELNGLSGAITDTARNAVELRESARTSKTQLSGLIDQTRQAASDAKSGSREILVTGAASAELKKNLRELNATTLRESEEAGKISQSLKAITDIVEQTHILATNASIEAARAGKQGAGFAVIAQEVRKLAASSRTALEDIAVVLSSVKTGIDDSGRFASLVSSSAEKLDASLTKSRTVFEEIDARIVEIETGINRFDGVFTDQIERASATATAAEGETAMLERFSADFRTRSAEYDAISSSAESSENYAIEAKRSARVLAQVAGYLKVGGTERNRILRKYTVSRDAGQRKFKRKDRREELLYNLELFDTDGNAMGHLGDLSASGLSILSEKDIPAGNVITIRVVLPLTSEGERTIQLRIRTRRSESDCDGFRIGCSFEGGDSAQAAHIKELIQTLTLGALTAPQALSAADKNEDIEDVEELQEI